MQQIHCMLHTHWQTKLYSHVCIFSTHTHTQIHTNKDTQNYTHANIHVYPRARKPIHPFPLLHSLSNTYTRESASSFVFLDIPPSLPPTPFFLVPPSLPPSILLSLPPYLLPLSLPLFFFLRHSLDWRWNTLLVSLRCRLRPRTYGLEL